MTSIARRLIALLTGRASTPAAAPAEAPAPARAAVTAPIDVAATAAAPAPAPAADLRVEAEAEVLAAPAADAIVLQTPPRAAEPAPAAAQSFRVPAFVADAPQGVGPLASRIGGMPWLGDAEFWPHSAEGRPMTFLAQINFAEIPATEGLPTAGLLRLFVDETFDGAITAEGVVSVFAAAPEGGAIHPSQRGSSLVNTIYPIALGFGAAEADAAPSDALARIGGRALNAGDDRFDRALIDIRAASAFLPSATDIAVLVPAEKLDAGVFDEMRLVAAQA